jgi:peptidoglycan hydrolase-like protein with peptidoglycan-binding domain
MNTKKIIFLALGGIATAGVGYLFYNLLRKKPQTFQEAIEDTKNTIVEAPSDISSVVTSSYTDKGFPLKKGSGGAKVEALQRFLNQSSGYNLVVDGKYGQYTEGAVYTEQSPFDVFKGMYPDAVKGQVTEGYYNAFIKGKF